MPWHLCLRPTRPLGRHPPTLPGVFQHHHSSATRSLCQSLPLPSLLLAIYVPLLLLGAVAQLPLLRLLLQDRCRLGILSVGGAACVRQPRTGSATAPARTSMTSVLFECEWLSLLASSGMPARTSAGTSNRLKYLGRGGSARPMRQGAVAPMRRRRPRTSGSSCAGRPAASPRPR